MHLLYSLPLLLKPPGLNYGDSTAITISNPNHLLQSPPLTAIVKLAPSFTTSSWRLNLLGNAHKPVATSQQGTRQEGLGSQWAAPGLSKLQVPTFQSKGIWARAPKVPFK